MIGIPYKQLDVSRSTHFSNYSDRGDSPLGYCVHTTSGSNSLPFLQSDRRFSTGASCADYLINRNGSRYKLIPEGKFAYHVGQARWGNHTNEENLLSRQLVGIELEQVGSQLCTWEQVDSLAELVVAEGIKWGHRWPYIILGHYELAYPMGRRSDPQGFDWGSFMGFLYVRAKAKKVEGL